MLEGGVRGTETAWAGGSLCASEDVAGTSTELATSAADAGGGVIAVAVCAAPVAALGETASGFGAAP